MQIGCKCDFRFFRVMDCSSKTTGGFVPGMGVVLCHNFVQDSSEIRNTMVHELVHAYDHCRAANMDWVNCRHHACSEVCTVLVAVAATPCNLGQTRDSVFQVRAANLSGDCTAQMEWKRGRTPYWPGYQKSCVRRRAELSVSMNANCKHNAAAGTPTSCS